MSKEFLQDSIGHIDDDMIESVDKIRGRSSPRRSRYLKYIAAAACFCVIILGAVAIPHLMPSIAPESSGDDGTDGGYDHYGSEGMPPIYGLDGAEIVGSTGVTIPKTQVSLNYGSTADMMPFFIYDGRMYVQYETVYGRPEIAGNYVGTSVGLIDEWTPKDGYVDYAGSIAGDFYTVQGFDPSFMLCMKENHGSVTIYINNSGLTLYIGADLFESRLHLKDNLAAVDYQTRHDWFNSLGNIKRLPTEASGVLESFLSELNKGRFMPTSAIPLSKEQKNIYDREIYHMFLRLNNGMTVHLRLFDGGYVCFDGMLSVCVKMNKSIFDSMIAEFKDPSGSSIPVNAQYIRTDGYVDGAVYPITTVIRSADELSSYCKKNGKKYDLSRKTTVYSDTTIGFLDACDRYTDSFFESNDLILVLLEEGSGSVRHSLEGVTKTEGEIRIDIDRHVPEIGTDDMAQWHIIIEVPKDTVSKSHKLIIE